ncbi:MAG: hypothetical protein IPM38_10160 [Ignavibacteria bacterium]|nr:hypothetical protein [Ignavibacteria bacterium]
MLFNKKSGDTIINFSYLSIFNDIDIVSATVKQTGESLLKVKMTFTKKNSFKVIPKHSNPLNDD